MLGEITLLEDFGTIPKKQRHRNIVLEREITLIIKHIDMDCAVVYQISALDETVYGEEPL